MKNLKKILFLNIIFVMLMCSIMCIMCPNHTIDRVDAKELSSGKSMCVIEKNSKKVLYSKNMDMQLANASTTKIITAITVLENCENLDEVITINDMAVGIEGTSIYLRKNEEVKVRDLLYGLMLRSGNDSACALAYHVGGSLENFVGMMNDLVRKLDLKNSHFMNPHGLDQEGHYTSAYDLAVLTAYALNNPIFKEIVSTKQHVIPQTNMSETRYLTNKNKLLNSLTGCVGVKTGYTNKAGRCLVSACEREGMTLVCVVLNCGPMFEESSKLLVKGFNEYDYAKIVDENEIIYNEYYINNERGILNLKSNESYYLPILKGEEKDIVIKYSLKEFQGDVDEGEEIGEINVFVDNRLQKTIKLYTINKIDVLNNVDALKSIQLEWEEKYEVK